MFKITLTLHVGIARFYCTLVPTLYSDQTYAFVFSFLSLCVQFFTVHWILSSRNIWLGDKNRRKNKAANYHACLQNSPLTEFNYEIWNMKLSICSLYSHSLTCLWFYISIDLLDCVLRRIGNILTIEIMNILIQDMTSNDTWYILSSRNFESFVKYPLLYKNNTISVHSIKIKNIYNL